MGSPVTPPRRCVALLTAAVLWTACDRRVEAWRDPAEEPARATRPVRVPGLEQPAAQPMAGLAAATGSGERIRGTLRVTEGALIPPGAVLFVIARSDGGGPPLAVKRLPAGPFPLEFEIGSEDAMIAGRPFAGPILLSARIDADGDPMTRGEQDLAGVASEPLAPGASDVELLLSQTGGG